MSEYEDQCRVFTWAEAMISDYPELEFLRASIMGIHVNIKLLNKYKKAGMKKGFPDIFFPVARGGYHGLFIEMKHGKNKPSPDQLRWLNFLTDQGYLCFCIWGADPAISEIEKYLKMQKTEGRKNASRFNSGRI